MNLKQLLAGFEAAVPAVGQIVVAMHPEDTAEGIKIAAGIQLFKFVVDGVHQIAAASAAAAAATPAPAVPTASAAPEVAAPNVSA